MSTAALYLGFKLVSVLPETEGCTELHTLSALLLEKFSERECK